MRAVYERRAGTHSAAKQLLEYRAKVGLFPILHGETRGTEANLDSCAEIS